MNSAHHTTGDSNRKVSNEAFITIDGLSICFGHLNALTHVSLSIEKGAIFGVVGSDGAGKSTLLRTMAMMIRPTKGNIIIGGRNTVEHRRELKPLIGYMPQRFGLYADLTVIENVNFFMDIFDIRGIDRRERIERYLGFSNLLPFVDRQAGNLSGGMKQKLGLACVLVHEPQVLILDEPTNGVDPLSRREFWDILIQMQAEGMTIVVSTAYLDEGEKCDRLALLHRAELIDVVSPRRLREGFPTLEDALIDRLTEADEELNHDSFKR